MSTETAEKSLPIKIKRPDANSPILFNATSKIIGVRAGTVITIGDIHHTFEEDGIINSTDLDAGCDYAVGINQEGDLFIEKTSASPYNNKFFGGFHFAPGGNATANSGGDSIPAINPHSIWDHGFRPINGVDDVDPRGMTRVTLDSGHSFWIDIYFLGINHEGRGTSLFGEKIAHGRSLDRLNYADATRILASHGKRLPTYDEFRAAAYGVTERSSADRHPEITGLDAARTSRFGLMQVTGNLWTWGTDGHPKDPRPSIFGGSWFHGSDAGSRYADLGAWAGSSGGDLGARGASDHLTLA